MRNDLNHEDDCGLVTPVRPLPSQPAQVAHSPLAILIHASICHLPLVRTGSSLVLFVWSACGISHGKQEDLVHAKYRQAELFGIPMP